MYLLNSLKFLIQKSLILGPPHKLNISLTKKNYCYIIKTVKGQLILYKLSITF